MKAAYLNLAGRPSVLMLALYMALLLLPYINEARADDLPRVMLASSLAESEINGKALSNVSGALGVNQAAGDGNAQANSRAIAVSQGQGVAIAYVGTAQASESNSFAMPDVAIARIADTAFQNVSGLISVNQAGGVSNMQLNTFVLSRSINGEVSDAALADTLADATAASGEGSSSSSSRRIAEVESGAFSGASGVVQLNQAAGSGNLTSNRFEMSLSPNH